MGVQKHWNASLFVQLVCIHRIPDNSLVSLAQSVSHANFLQGTSVEWKIVAGGAITKHFERGGETMVAPLTYSVPDQLLNMC